MSEHDEDRAERALREALRRHADEPNFAPLTVPVPLPAAEHHRRMPRWLPAVAALALVIATALPVMLNGFKAPTDSSGAPAGAPAPEASVGRGAPASPAQDPTGWRWESFRVLTYQVPTSWSYGWAPRADWCADRDKTIFGAFVDVGAQAETIRTIACPRAIPGNRVGMFVTVRSANAGDRGWDLPQGWAVTDRVINGYRLEVVHPEREARVAAEIVASARPLSAVDGNGCPATGSEGAELSNAQGSLSLCQYDTRGDQQLLASKRVTGTQVSLIEEALRAAPQGSGPDRAGCDDEGKNFVRVRLPGAFVSVRYAGCAGNGIEGLGESRRLTADACRAVLQPPLTFTEGYDEGARLCRNTDPTPSAIPPSPKR